MKLEGMGADGIMDYAFRSPGGIQAAHPRPACDMAATAELKARGIHYVLIKPDNPGAGDLLRYPSAWGLTLAGAAGDVRLFHIQ